MANASALREKEYSDVSAMLSSQNPTRVAVIVRARSRLSGQESSTIISDALSVLQLSTEPLFLIRERWRRFDVVVFDLFNIKYDWKTAHIPGEFPTVLVDYGRENPRVSVAASMFQREVNEGVAEHHRLNGWHTCPPYFADHTLPRPPSYEAPRGMQCIPPSCSTNEAELNAPKD